MRSVTVKNDVDGLLNDIDGTISFGGAPLPGVVARGELSR